MVSSFLDRVLGLQGRTLRNTVPIEPGNLTGLQRKLAWLRSAATVFAPMSNDPSKSEPNHVEAVDNQGRRVRIPRDEYRSKVLPDLVKQHENDPERLAAVIVQGLRDGFAADLLAAANRLTVVDKGNLERALGILAMVQRDAGELDMAESTLNELLQKRPGSPVAYVGLGMLQERRGDLDGCERLLWQALEADCNHPDAVHGYLQIRRRRVGESGYRSEIEKVMALPGSWRARLWLARLLLEQGDEPGAAEVYREALAGDEVSGDVLLMAAVDLLQHDKQELLAELVRPRFEPGRHHPHVGLALLQHFRARGDHANGEALLHQMFVYYGHVIPGELQPFTAEFDRMRLAELPPLPALPKNPRVHIVRLDRPLWYAGLDDPQWLLPPKPQGHKHVIVFAPSMDGQTKLEPQLEEEVGRAMRGLPLWLTEQVWLTTQNRATAALSLAENGTWAVLGQPWPEAELARQVAENERADTLLVTGTFRVDGDRRRVDLYVYDCGRGERVASVFAEGAHQEHGELLLKLMADLWPAIGGAAGHKPPLGDAPFWHRYADGLAQYAAVVASTVGQMPKERLFGVRYITGWLQALALADTRWQPGLFLLGSAMCTLHDLGSKVPAEHARLWSEVFRQSPANAPLARLAARILPACGLLPQWQGRQQEIVAAAQGEPNVRAWLQRNGGA